jgi:hypothetical protein
MLGPGGVPEAGIDGPGARDDRHESDDCRVSDDDGRRNRYVDG